jgi:4-carboxymuconolactone decarboxylase
MGKLPKPPARYEQFVERFPQLGRAWNLISEAGASGPVDEKTARLIKLGIAVGALREGAVHASVRKGLAQGLSMEEMEHVVVLAAGTIGLPAAVSVFLWIRDIPKREEEPA